MDSSIVNPQPLGFNPNEFKDKKVAAIWRNPLTRTLWMAFKSCHIVSQYFNDDIINLARLISLEERPVTMKALRGFKPYCQDPIFEIPASHDKLFHDGDLFSEDLLLYINGEKGLGWYIKPQEEELPDDKK